MQAATPPAMDMLVSTDWLARELGADDLVVLDASLHLPQVERRAAEEYADSHIPGARFLDLASLHDPSSHMPGKIPDAVRVESRLVSLGVHGNSRIVLYDDSSMRTSCRAWFLLHMFGLEKLAVLDGGFSKWRGEGRALETDIPSPATRHGLTLVPDRAIVRDKAQMLQNIQQPTEQIIDARDQARFRGDVADHVHGLPGGHIPGACNVPFTALLRDDGSFRSDEEMAMAFEEAGIDIYKPVVTTCGSGVTASVVTFALHLLGVENVALYDGSWSEWGADPDTPKHTGEAR